MKNKILIMGTLLAVVLILLTIGCKDSVLADAPVAFLSAVQVGGASGTVDSSALTLTFDVDPATLTVDDITLTGATKGALTGSGTTRILTITGITVDNGESVSIAIASPAGYAVSGSPRTAVVHRKIYALRETGPAGGLIFYDKGSYSDGWRYLEVAPANEPDTYNWGTDTNSFTGTSYDIGTGKANTALMAGAEYPAAEAVRAATHGGYTDWFLPSKDEMFAMYENLHQTYQLGDLVDVNGHWSSSEGNENYAWYLTFVAGGSQSFYSWWKNDLRKVRAVRSFYVWPIQA